MLHINKPHIQGIYRELGPICRKHVYTHDSVVVCNLDGDIYHSKCFGIDKRIAAEIIYDKDWFCPNCCSDIFPHFNDDTFFADIKSKPCYCNGCRQIISRTRHTSTHCYQCLKMFHKRCISSNLCKSCAEGDNNSAPSTLNDLNDYKIFNPYVHMALAYTDELCYYRNS